jgi:hypothetical protein
MQCELHITVAKDECSVGVQPGTRPAAEHIAPQLTAALEAAVPWTERVPPWHVSTMM